jgi:cell division protein FtsB
MVLLLLVVVAAGLRSRQELSAVRERERNLVAQIHDTQANIATLERRIARLKDDPAELERSARRDLGMVRPGDVVIVLPASSPSSPSSRH